MVARERTRQEAVAMTEAKAQPGVGQEALLGGDQVDKLRRVGNVEAAVRRAIKAAALAAVDEGAAELAAAKARAVDIAVTRSDPYGVAAAGRELREQLARLRLDPASREGGPSGDVEAFLAQLAQAE
jgi:hypothetical protein